MVMVVLLEFVIDFIYQQHIHFILKIKFQKQHKLYNHKLIQNI